MEKGFFPPQDHHGDSASHLCVHISDLGKAPALFYRSVITSVIKLRECYCRFGTHEWAREGNQMH